MYPISVVIARSYNEFRQYCFHAKLNPFQTRYVRDTGDTHRLISELSGYDKRSIYPKHYRKFLA
jgi:hypothetical protein